MNRIYPLHVSLQLSPPLGNNNKKKTKKNEKKKKHRNLVGKNNTIPSNLHKLFSNWSKLARSNEQKLS